MELRFRGRIVVIVCYRFCFYTPTLHHIPCKRKKNFTSQHTPEFIDAPPRGERSELKLIGVMFLAGNEKPKSLQLNSTLLGVSCIVQRKHMLSLNQTPSPSSNPWTQAKTAAKSGISSRTSEQQSFPSVGVCFSTCKRDGNRAAHELARDARLSGLSKVWKGVTPPQIQHVLLNDSL